MVGMFWLGFMSAFGVAAIAVILWIKWDEGQQMKALDRENTELLLYRVSDLEDKVAAIVAKEILVHELGKGGKRA